MSKQKFAPAPPIIGAREAIGDYLAVRFPPSEGLSEGEGVVYQERINCAIHEALHRLPGVVADAIEHEARSLVSEQRGSSAHRAARALDETASKLRHPSRLARQRRSPK
jgi:hypothetical protein